MKFTTTGSQDSPEMFYNTVYTSIRLPLTWSDNSFSVTVLEWLLV